MRWLYLRRHSQLPFRRSHTTLAQPVVLRPYQESCLQSCLDGLAAGASRIGVSLPTGSGKTTVFMTLLSRLKTPAQSSDANRSLVVVNSIELARQSAAQATKLNPSWTVEIEQGAKHQATGRADITIATYQTLLRQDRLAKFDPRYLKAIIIDEAHHAAAPSYRKILAHFDENISHPDPDFSPPALPHKIPIVGFSATFSRHDGLALGSVFERIVYHRDFLEMIKEQWLCQVKFTSVKANIDLSTVTVNSRTGDFNATSLAHIINTDTINEVVVKSWLDRAATRKSTLVFCVNLAHVRDLTQKFRDFGIDARYIYANTPAMERKDLVQGFRSGEFPVLVNCAILTEGADIPNIDCVLLARPTRSRNVFAQMIGRGMRLSAETGKEDCHIIDFVESISRVDGVVTIPTLFGLNPSEIVTDESLEELQARAEYPGEIGSSGSISDASHVPPPKSISYIDHDHPFELALMASGAPNIRNLSRHDWVGCGDDIYVLECLGKGHLRIEPITNDEGQHFEGHFTPPTMNAFTARILKISPHGRKQKIVTAATLADAIRASDTYALNKVLQGPMALGLLRSARWRKDPATPSQKQWVAKRWKVGELPETSSEQLSGKAKTVQNLTKGEAANIITRLKHGAQSRYEAKVKKQSKLAVVAEKERRRKQREDVRIGPLQIEDADIANALPAL